MLRGEFFTDTDGRPLRQGDLVLDLAWNSTGVVIRKMRTKVLVEFFGGARYARPPKGLRVRVGVEDVEAPQ